MDEAKRRLVDGWLARAAVCPPILPPRTPIRSSGGTGSVRSTTTRKNHSNASRPLRNAPWLVDLTRSRGERGGQRPLLRVSAPPREPCPQRTPGGFRASAPFSAFSFPDFSRLPEILRVLAVRPSRAAQPHL